jgi:PAS domain S-box-containing protein
LKASLQRGTPPGVPRSSGFILPLTLVTALLFAGICAALYYHDAGQIERGRRERETVRAKTFAQMYGDNFQPVANDVLALASGDGLQAFLDRGQKSDLERATRRARFFSLRQSSYDQIRYLDEHGREIIRIARNGEIVPEGRLRREPEANLLQATRSLASGQIYISSMDLSSQDGRVDEPIKPTVRVATPVFDEVGRRRGTYVVNFLTADAIKQLQDFLPTYQNRLRLINAQGYWLKAADSAQEWGFMYPERAGATLARSDPALWSKISHEPEGQVMRDGGLLTWSHLLPGRMVLGAGAAPTAAADPFLVFATEISAADWDEVVSGPRQEFMAVALVMVLFIGVSGWFLENRRLARKEQERFFTLSLDLLCIASANGYFKRVSPAVTDILGWSVREFLERPFIEFVHPDDRAATLREVEGQVVSGKRVLEFENRYLCKDGSWRVLSWRSMPYAGGLMYATARDVTGLRQSEAQIRRLNEDLQGRAAQLENANKELEAFSYSVSHDLRAPLRHIDGFAGLLRKSDGERVSEQGKGHLAHIINSAKKMGTLIDDLLSFSRMGRSELHIGRVDLQKLLDESIASLSAETERRNIRWTKGKLPVVPGDYSMLRQVFVNLLSNAVKYTGPRAAPEIEVGSLDGEEGEVVIFVRDNGVGFEMKYAQKLFGVFQRLHRAEEFEGTGIGLANVRRIVARHGGRTWAEGSADAGATFFFSLPRQSKP